MSKPQKKNPSSSLSRSSSRHDSGISMATWLFLKVDRMVELLDFKSREEFLILGTTLVLEMCEDRTKRYLPEIVLKYDALRPHRERRDENIATPNKTRRCGTHFSHGLEERIASVVRHVLWSRNQFVGEAMKSIIEMCEEPSKRVLPIVVVFYEAARAHVPLKLTPRP